ncbi:MAG: hypothetical protein PSY12_11060, partial [bacterium]|nr:hypothetical protein [bacterium]
MMNTGLRLLGAAAAMMIATWAGAANAPSLVALRGIETGEWELRLRGADGQPRKMCVRDARQLL